MKNTRPIILRVDENLVLRQYTINDAAEIFRLVDENREHLSQHGENPDNEYPTEQLLSESIIYPRNPRRFRFGIWDKDILVGGVNITLLINRSAELGYWLGAKYERQGFATKAARRLIQSIFNKGKTVNIFVDVAKTNAKSIAVLMRLGFQLSTKGVVDDTYLLKKWLPFYLDALSYHGVVATHSQWVKIVERYGGDLERLKRMRANSHSSPSNLPDFGEGAAYHAPITLGKWAATHGIDLDIPESAV